MGTEQLLSVDFVNYFSVAVSIFCFCVNILNIRATYRLYKRCRTKWNLFLLGVVIVLSCKFLVRISLGSTMIMNSAIPDVGTAQQDKQNTAMVVNILYIATWMGYLFTITGFLMITLLRYESVRRLLFKYPKVFDKILITVTIVLYLLATISCLNQGEWPQFFTVMGNLLNFYISAVDTTLSMAFLYQLRQLRLGLSKAHMEQRELKQESLKENSRKTRRLLLATVLFCLRPVCTAIGLTVANARPEWLSLGYFFQGCANIAELAYPWFCICFIEVVNHFLEISRPGMSLSNSYIHTVRENKNKDSKTPIIAYISEETV